MIRIAALMKKAVARAKVESATAKRSASRRPLGVPLVAPRLHDRGMEIEVVGRHRRPQDSDGDISVGGIGDDPGLRHEARDHIGDDGLGDGDLEEEASRDQPDQRDDEGLELTEAVTLQQEDDEDVQRRHANSQQHRHAEQKVERDGGADDLRQVRAQMAISPRTQSPKPPGPDSYHGRPGPGRGRLRCRDGR